MPPQDLNKLISYLKWSAFVFCKIAFIWKVTDGIKSYISKDIGTKTTMLENYEADLPGKLKKLIEKSFTNFFFQVLLFADIPIRLQVCLQITRAFMKLTT